ncbi:hydrophobe/amphiphile efflux-1 (HAE1) family protein [Paraburkholderia sp. MM5482-R2]
MGLSASEVLQAIQEQNSQTAGGSLGDQPIAPGSEFTAQIVTQSRFTTPEQFREIIVHANPDGSTVRVGDVARVELGNDSYGNRLTVNGKASAGIAIQLASGANALAVANAVRQRMAELQPIFPRGVVWTVPFDTTPFITTSVHGVIRTMVEALLLVTVVVFLFLQDWRATVIPTIVVPIALIGTCAGLYLFGLSINILSLFGMVVAIGILNDDAIVVVENVARIMREEGLGAPRATVKAIGQISGAAIASTLVLVAVFIPMAFFPGSTGGIYRQFSVTLAVSILLSTMLALTLGAALCAALLRSEAAAKERPKNAASRLLHRVFDGFNRGLDAGTTRYIVGVDAMLRSPLRWLLVFVAACAITVFFFTRLPTGFLPTEDQGHIFITYTGPPGSTDQRTQYAIDQVEAFLRSQPQVRNVASVTGFSFFGQGQSAALSFVDLKPWDERSGEANSASALVRRANAAFRQIPEAIIFALDPPPIPSLGNATGFTMKIQDRSGIGGEALQQAARRMMIEASQSPLLAGVRAEGMPEAPQLYVEIDRVKARALGLQIGQVNQALALTFGSNYVNDFVFEGNVLRVLLQADAEQRMRAEDVTSLRLRNNRGEMVPFSAFTRVRWISGPQQLERYNGFPSATLSGQAAPGRSSGAAIAEMERIASHVLTGNLTYEWTRHRARGKTGERPDRHAARAVARGRVPVARGAVRELGDSGRGVADHPVRRDRRGTVDDAAWTVRGRVFQHRPRDDHRPCREERHPHRRICDQGGIRRKGRASRRQKRRTAASAPDSDDERHVRVGHAAARARDRRGRGEPPRGRHRRDGQHANRDDVRRLLYAAVLCRRATLAEPQETQHRSRR